MSTLPGTTPQQQFGVRPPAFRLPEAAHVGRVTLQVAALERSLGFYLEVVGLRLMARGGDAGRGWARLGPLDSDVILLELREAPGARPVPRRGLLGLYHFAILLPDRPALGRFMRHLRDIGAPAGAADHVFSEALYLTDPDGLGVEIYRDRPRSTWQIRDGELLSGADPLDAPGLLESAGEGSWSGVPAGSVIGHVHFYVDDLPEAEAFYHAALGMDKTIWNWPGALFVSAGGYHHHVGLNTWAAGAPAATDADARLLSWELLVPDEVSIEAVHGSLTGAGYASNPADAGVQAVDPWGIGVRIVLEAR